VDFEVLIEKELETIEEVISLGDSLTEEYSTSKVKLKGLFRGQVKDWKLIPSSYRDVEPRPEEENKNLSQVQYYHLINNELRKFIEICTKEIDTFPRGFAEQMVLAQHYGVNTPLLDWSSNLFVAIFFGINERYRLQNQPEGKMYLYHIPDAMIAQHFYNLKDYQYITQNDVLVVKPFPIDQRIQRQFSYFTYHPLPGEARGKIGIHKYHIGTEVLEKLDRISRGFGYSQHYFFADYSSIANNLKLS